MPASQSQISRDKLEGGVGIQTNVVFATVLFGGRNSRALTHAPSERAGSPEWSEAVTATVHEPSLGLLARHRRRASLETPTLAPRAPRLLNDEQSSPRADVRGEAGGQGWAGAEPKRLSAKGYAVRIGLRKENRQVGNERQNPLANVATWRFASLCERHWRYGPAVVRAVQGPTEPPTLRREARPSRKPTAQRA